ncbi:MAG TPA: H-X9-DG-CTERM domain-containing protein [Tepidisphaeraceae bacterium]|nr:H-X9-DG-CTERM domain-containing protein [Tepidisphaeraceae bacterium]
MRLRQTGNPGKCPSNLRQIGQAILLYANDHHGAYPDSVSTILLEEEVTSQLFICPTSNDTPATGPTTQAVAANLTAGGHLSYIYLGRGWTVAMTPANAIVAYEPLSNHGGDGMNVLFGDGHVEFLSAIAAKPILANAAPGNPPVTLPSQ